MLEAEHVGFSLSGRTLLSDVSLRLAPGETVALLGANGAGKTTLMRVLAGLATPDTGVVRLVGKPIGSLDAQARARKIAWLPQDGGSAWPISVERLVALGRHPWRAPYAAMSEADQAAIEQAMLRTGTLGFRSRPFPTLSCGERARVLLARALATGAPCLLADEPVAALDPAQAMKMLALLRSLAEEGLAVIAVVHDIMLAARFFPRVLLLADGKLLADGPPDRVLTEAHVARAFGIGIRHVGDAILPGDCL